MVSNGQQLCNIVQYDPKWSNMVIKFLKLVQNGPKWSKFIQYDPKWSNMIKPCLELSQVVKRVPYTRKCSQMVQRGQKGSKKVQHGPTWSKNSPTMSKMFQNVPKRSNIFQSDPKRVRPNQVPWSSKKNTIKKYNYFKAITQRYLTQFFQRKSETSFIFKYPSSPWIPTKTYVNHLMTHIFLLPFSDLKCWCQLKLGNIMINTYAFRLLEFTKHNLWISN